MSKITYDMTTRNKSFSDFAKTWENRLKIDPKECLSLVDTDLMWVDPLKDRVSEDVARKIINECIINPWYFLREIAVDSNGNRFTMDIAKFVVTYLVFNGVNTYYNAPEYTHRDEYAGALVQSVRIVREQDSTTIAISAKNRQSIIDYVSLPSMFSFIPHDNLIVSIVDDYNIDHLIRGKSFNMISMFYSDDIISLEKIIKYTNVTLTGDKMSSKNIVTDCLYPKIGKCMLLVGSPTDTAATKGLQNVSMRCDIKADEFNINSPEFKKGLQFMWVEFDAILTEVDLYESVIEIVKNNPNSDYMKLIKKFTSQVLLKRYDDLDILDKLHINKIFADIYNDAIVKSDVNL